jgi:hypothetical protein
VKPASNGGKPAQKASAPATTVGTAIADARKELEGEDSVTTTPPAPGAVPLMRFPFPLRDAVDVWLTLPRDLTREEADRLAVFIRSLARADQESPASEPAAS